LIGLAVAVAACGHLGPMMNEAQMSDLSLTLQRQGEAWSVHISIKNSGSQPLHVSYLMPFIAFSLEAHDAHEQKLAIHKPPVNVPSQERTLEIPPGASAEIPSPVQLRFGAVQNDRRFLWTILCSPQPVTLTVKLDLPGLGPRTATTRLEPDSCVDLVVMRVALFALFVCACQPHGLISRGLSLREVGIIPKG
jgi:hypothetical protein